MERLGIITGADLRAKPLEFVQAHFGKSGGWYYRISRGIDERRPVQPNRQRKSVGAEDTFVTDMFDLEAAKAELTPLAETVWRHCQAKQITGRTVTLKVKFADFQQVTRSRTLSRPIGDPDEMLDAVRDLLAGTFPVTKGIRLLGVTLSSLEQEHAGAAGGQLALF